LLPPVTQLTQSANRQNGEFEAGHTRNGEFEAAHCRMCDIPNNEPTVKMLSAFVDIQKGLK
jgi:hypothetical protein